MYHWNSFLFQRNLNTHFWVFIKLKFLGILNSSQSFEEQVMTCSNCNYTIWEKKNWMQLYLNLFPYLSLHIYLLLGSWQVTRWGEHVYLVRSGGARNYVFMTFSWTFLRGVWTFLYKKFSTREYLWHWEIIVCKFLALIKLLPVNDDYFLHPKFELHRYLGFLYQCRFYWKKHMLHMLVTSSLSG